MGLAERRAAKNFETNLFPGFLKQIHEAAGFAVPVEIAWDTLAADEQAHLYEESWPKVYFHPLIAALKAIAVDDMGKEALQGGLKKVVIRNQADNSSYMYWASFEGGALTLDHKPTTNIDDVEQRTDSLREALEKGL